MQRYFIGASNSRRLCRTKTKSIFSGLNIELDSKDHYKFLEAEKTDHGNRMAGSFWRLRQKPDYPKNNRRGEFRSSGQFFLEDDQDDDMKRKSFKRGNAISPANL